MSARGRSLAAVSAGALEGLGEARTRPAIFFIVPLGAALLGGVASLSLPAAAAVLLLGVLLVAFASNPHKNEIIVGVYWLAFCIYETVLSGTSISGFFYPFYLYFLLTLVLGLAAGRTRLHTPTVLLYLAFMIVVVVSFVGFQQAVTFEVMQRVVAYALGIMVAVQFRSVRGLHFGAAGFLIGSLVIAIWVIDASIRSDFAYRAGVDVNQNDLSEMVALGLVPALALLLRQLVDSGRNWLLILGLAAAAGTMLYSMALLASRGMTLAVLLAVAFIVMRLVTLRPARAFGLAFVLAAGGLVLLLPGGASIVERFGERNVTTANHRAGLWSVTLEEYKAGNVYDFLFGYGFDSNKELLRREIGWTTSTHNAYLQLLYEFGLVGILLFVALLVYFLYIGWRSRSEMGLVMMGLAVFVIGANLSSNGPNGFVFWLTLGFMAACANLQTDQAVHQRLETVGSEAADHIRVNAVKS